MPSAVAVIPAIPAALSFVLHERGRVGPRAARAELRDRVGAAITLSAPLQGTPIGDAHGKTRTSDRISRGPRTYRTARISDIAAFQATASSAAEIPR